MKNKISVGLPIVKIEFVEQAIESILNQTYKDFEIIIVNNGAPQKLKDILSKFNDNRIRYYENKNQLDIISNWNLVLSYAKGEYFVLFSDDDVMELNFLSELYALSQRYPTVNIFHTRVKKIDTNGKTIGFTPLCHEFESLIDFIWHIVFEYRNIFATEFMCRTQVLKELGGFIDFPLAWGSDYATYIQVASIENRGIAYSSKPLVSWRISDKNLSNIGSIRLRLEALKKYHNWFINFVNSLSPINEKEFVQISQIKNQLNIFFKRKREYLFHLQLDKKGLLKTFFSNDISLKNFDLPAKNIIYQLLRKQFQV